MKTVTAIEHKGVLYRDEEDLANEVMRRKFYALVEKDKILASRSDVVQYAIWRFFQDNENDILELLKDRYSGKLIEDLKNEKDPPRNDSPDFYHPGDII